MSRTVGVVCSDAVGSTIREAVGRCKGGHLMLGVGPEAVAQFKDAFLKAIDTSGRKETECLLRREEGWWLDSWDAAS